MEQQHNEHLFQQQQAEQRLQQEEAEQYLQQQEAEQVSQQQQFALQNEPGNEWSQQQSLQGDGHVQYEHYKQEQTLSKQFVQHQTDHPAQQQYVDQDQQHFSEVQDEQQEDSVELFTEEDEIAPLPANLQRRPSASRPTDIDDLILKHNTKMNSYSGEQIHQVHLS